MSQIYYITMADSSRSAKVIEMMNRLYVEDPSAVGVDPNLFAETIRYFLSNPQMGRIVLFLDGEMVRGYAIVVPFWSNEFGGVMLLIDELFVLPESRGRGIARGFFAMIERDRPFDSIGVFLEVAHTNQKAEKLYRSLGLQRRSNSALYRRF